VLDDSRLVELARQRDHGAFQTIYEAYRGKIHTYISRLVNDVELANDLTQETFLRAYQAFPNFGKELKLLPWLYRIAGNAAIDALRRRRVISWVSLDESAGSGEFGANDPPKSEDELVRTALSRLPREGAMCLLLHNEGYSYEEIAQIQEVSLAAVKSRLFRARELFRKIYDKLTQKREGTEPADISQKEISQKEDQ